VIEEHDAKIDALNDKIIIIDTLKETLHKAELAETKATQGKLEAVMEKEVIEQNLDALTKKYDALGIINQEAKDKLSEARHDRNVFEAISKRSDEERDKAVALAQRLQERGEKLEAKTSSTNSTSKILIEENNTLKSEITEMTSAIKDLTEELLFVSKENKEMLAELKKPRFASIASISKKEGFKFPTSYEPRANSLGTGKPTLLRKKD
jgi:chromosome segregation ATPase